MHGLMGERLLKRFLKGILRKPKIVSASETEPEPVSGVQTKDGPDRLENVQPQGKEAQQSIEKTSEWKDGLNKTSDIPQASEDLPKTK